MIQFVAVTSVRRAEATGDLDVSPIGHRNARAAAYRHVANRSRIAVVTEVVCCGSLPTTAIHGTGGRTRSLSSDTTKARKPRMVRPGDRAIVRRHSAKRSERAHAADTSGCPSVAARHIWPPHRF